MHAEGKLTDEEFARVKERMLARSRSTMGIDTEATPLETDGAEEDGDGLVLSDDTPEREDPPDNDDRPT